MTTDEALHFLREHQPLPADAELDEALIGRFDSVRRHFVANPDPRSVPLLLNAFGDGSGLGVYPLVEDALRPHPNAEVVPHLASALRSPHRGVRYWSAQIAGYFPDAGLVSALTEMLREDDADLRTAAIHALEPIPGPVARRVLRDAREREQDRELRELLDDVLSGG